MLVAFLYGVWCAGLFPLILTPLLPVGRVRELATELRCAAVHRRRPGPAGRRCVGGPDRLRRAGHRTTHLGQHRQPARGGPHAGQPSVQRHRLCRQSAARARRPLAGGAAPEPRGRAVDPVPLPARRGDGAHRRSGSFREDDTVRTTALALLPRATRLSVVPAQLQRCSSCRKTQRRAAQRAGRRSGGCSSAPSARAGGRHPGAAHYGSTEMASQVATAAPGADLPPGASGRVLPHRRLRIHDGDIEVGGETLFAGYLSPDGIKPPPLEPGGWFRTGDCGHLDAGGFLTVTGRADGMFLSGGENIHPQEIEEVLGAHPAVAVAVVVPAPDPEFGSRPVAFIDSTRQLPGGRRAAGPARRAAAPLQAPRALPADAGGRPHAPRQAGPRTTHRAGPHQRRRSGLTVIELRHS